MSALRHADTPGGRVPAVLMIEDDPGVADVMFRTLSEQGYEITVTDRGLQGLEFARARDYDLVLLDLLLPDVDGATLLQRLLSVRSGLQVVVVSALSNVEARVRCLELGAADYLPKPFALEELAARVRASIRAGDSKHSARYLQAGDLTIDVDRRLAVVDGRTVHLSTREFFLLEHLLRREGEVCPRKELLEYVWGYTFDPGTNVVDVYIRRLRQKVGDSRIETVRNVGYAMVGT